MKLLFIHIPKTAGTSFRKAVEQYFGTKDTIYDYGTSSVETSHLITKYVYKQQDMYRLGLEIERKERLFFSGHFHVVKYMHFFQTLNVVTFVRDPVAQVISHYKHYVSYNGYKKDIISFIKDDRFRNVQSRILSGKPLELFGFIGLTERYNDSIEMINDYYGIDIKVLALNESKKMKLPQAAVDQEIINLIKEVNQADILLYDKAKKIFEKRLDDHKKRKQYTHIWIQEKNKQFIRGCAFARNMTEPIEVKICNEEGAIASVQAKSFRPGLVVHNVPRKSFIGFEFNTQNIDKDKMFFICH